MSVPADFCTASEFFSVQPDTEPYLTPAVAAEVCRTAAAKGFLVSSVEGGVWDGKTFEARLDCIWVGPRKTPASKQRVLEANEQAAQFIEERAATIHNAFTITIRPLD